MFSRRLQPGSPLDLPALTTSKIIPPTLVTGTEHSRGPRTQALAHLHMGLRTSPRRDTESVPMGPRHAERGMQLNLPVM